MTDLEIFKAMLSKQGDKFTEANHGPHGGIVVTFQVGPGIAGGGPYFVDAWFRQDGSFYDFSSCD